MDDTVKQALLSAIRNLLAAGGAALAAKGFIDEATVSQVIGSVMVIVPIVWGVWDKYRAERKTQIRVEEAKQAVLEEQK
jgi:hypothetical protein